MTFDRDYYLAQQIATASPAMLIAMLYDGLVANVSRAIDAFERDDRVGARGPLIKSQEIVLELRMALDFERGTEIAANLDRLYDFVYSRLLDASLSASAASARDALSVTQTLRAAWREACLGQGALVAAP